jgi:hypothetical protein
LTNDRNGRRIWGLKVAYSEFVPPLTKQERSRKKKEGRKMDEEAVMVVTTVF